MSFGWSANDIVGLARLSYEVYSFCKIAPAELHSLFDRLDKIGRKLERLSTILERSGLGAWERTPDLEKHLLDAKSCLEPLRPVTRRASSGPVKVKGLARLALNYNKLKLIEKSLDEDEREIDTIKIDLILECSLRNLPYGSAFHLHPSDPPSISWPGNEALIPNDQQLPAVAALSNASLSLRADGSNNDTSISVPNTRNSSVMAMEVQSQPGGQNEAAAGTEAERESSLRNAQAISDLTIDVVPPAHEAKLCSKGVDSAPDPEQLSEVTGMATQFRVPLRLSRDDPWATAADSGFPTLNKANSSILARSVFDELPSTSDDAITRELSLDRSQGHSVSSHTLATGYLIPPVIGTSRRLSYQSPSREYLGVADEISTVNNASVSDAPNRQNNEPPPRDHIRPRGRSQFSLTMDPKASMTCSFNIEDSEDLMLLRVTSASTVCADSDSAASSSGALPSLFSTSSSGSKSNTHSLPTGKSRISLHCIKLGARPIPHLLHPTVEGPTEEPDAPYTITFTEPQYISTEGVSERPHWTTSLMYIFHDKQDRLMLCEKIFGKTLVMSAGSNKITYDGKEISHMSAITLWFDGATKIYSITFLRTFAGKNKTAEDIQLRVCGLWDAKKALRNSSTVAIIAESMPPAEKGSPKFDGQSGVRSSTLFGGASSAISQKRKKSGESKCTVEFTQPNDRAIFLSHLK